MPLILAPSVGFSKNADTVHTKLADTDTIHTHRMARYMYRSSVFVRVLGWPHWKIF